MPKTEPDVTEIDQNILPDEVRFGDEISCGVYGRNQLAAVRIAVQIDGEELAGAYPVMMIMSVSEAKEFAELLLGVVAEVSN